MPSGKNPPRIRAPKIRGWGRAGRKVASMVIPSKKEKMQQRHRRKEKIRQEFLDTKATELI